MNKPLTADTITDDQIRALRDEAAVALDLSVSDLCTIALGEHEHVGETDHLNALVSGIGYVTRSEARQLCADAINAAKSAPTVRSVTLYWQTDEQTGGNAGWAYNVISRDGEHTSGGFEVGTSDDGNERLSAVRAAFATEWPEAAAQITQWDALPEGGWRGQK